MISPSEVSAVIVTRGDVDLGEILTSVVDAGITSVMVWDNSRPRTVFDRDRKVYGRYIGAQLLSNETVYVQDDDCLVPIAELLAEYEPGERLCNMSAGRWADSLSLEVIDSMRAEMKKRGHDL